MYLKRGKTIIFHKEGRINIVFDQNLDPCPDFKVLVSAKEDLFPAEAQSAD
jgi:hypothetical protein